MMALSAPLIPTSGLKAWEEYSVSHAEWLDESAYLKTTYVKHRDPLHGTIQDHEHDRRRNLQGFVQNQNRVNSSSLETPSISDVAVEVQDDDISTIPSEVWKWNGDEKVVVQPQSSKEIFAPLWQSSPADAGTINVDLLSNPTIEQLYTAMLKTRQTVMSQGVPIGNLFDWMFDPEEKSRKVEPHAFIMEPMYSDFDWQNSEPVGFFIALTSFRNLFSKLLPEGTNGIYCFIEDSCGSTGMTFRLDGPEVTFLGYGDFHNGYDEYEQVVQMELYETVTEELCVHQLHIYPSDAFVQSYSTNSPA